MCNFYGWRMELFGIANFNKYRKKISFKSSLYTGLNEKQIQRKYPELLNILDFIKTGKLISSLGGLDKLKTNQILKDLRSGEILNKYFLH